jgi:hypothetical protein
MEKDKEYEKEKQALLLKIGKGEISPDDYEKEIQKICEQLNY